MEPAKKKLKQSKSRFIIYSEEEIKQKNDAAKNINTSQSEERANNAFQKFLRECGRDDVKYWLYDEEDLDNMLSKFWFGARKDADDNYESDPEDNQRQGLMYSANTMRNFRYSINRILKSKGHNYDIIRPNSLSFQQSQRAFNASQKELKELGKAQVHSAIEINETGRYNQTSVFLHCDQFFLFFK